MRYLTFSTADNDRPRLGAEIDQHVVDVAAAASTAGIVVPETMVALVQAGPAAQDQVRKVLTSAPAATRRSLADVRLHAPIPRPGKNVFCMGLNYLAHARESGAARGKETKVPTRPVLFTKAPTTDGLLATISGTVPLSVSRREDVERLRACAQGRFVRV
jgi:2-keto-4-pentenoate hydratase/2-oxohepta-3-ene-1,7-dioic acid hydratase in catechol pathway